MTPLFTDLGKEYNRRRVGATVGVRRLGTCGEWRDGQIQSGVIALRTKVLLGI